MNWRIENPVRSRFNAGSDTAVKGTPGAKFPKAAHLLKHADFQRVYERGKRHFSGFFTVFYWRRERPAESDGTHVLSQDAAAPVRKQAWRTASITGPRVGFTVGRVLGGSVERNRIRRRTREAVRQYYSQYSSMPVDVVIHPKKTVLQADFVELSREIERAFQVVQQRTNQPIADGNAEETPARTAGRRSQGSGRKLPGPGRSLRTKPV